MAIFLCRPEVGPFRPKGIAAQIDRQQAVKVRQSLFGEQVQSEGNPGWKADSLRALPQLLHV